MLITKKHCPHCGHIYQRYTNHDKHIIIGSGCPIITCPKCSKEFIDKDIKEPAFSSSPEEVNIFNILTAPLYPFGIVGIVLLIIGIANTMIGVIIGSLIPFALYAYLLYIGIKNKDDISKDTMYNYNKSKERLSNKDYVILLLNLGYPVPKSFLRNNYPDLLNYKRMK